MPKHFTKTEDFTREEYLEVARRAKIFQDGIEKEGKDFAHVCSGKVLATMFFQESTRTSTGLQSAIIKLGGGYLGISGTAGTYLASGEEDLGDFLNSFATACDIMAIRHKSLNLDEIAPDFPVPLVNAMCGGDEHSIGALSMVYLLYRRNFDFKKLKYGIYGMIKSSRPAKGLIKALSIMGATIYEDPVIDEFETPPHIREFCEKVSKKTGSQLIKKKYEDFLSEVDFLSVVEGLPQAGEDEKLVEKYNQKFEVFTKKELDALKPGALMMYGMPRKMTDGRLIAKEEIDKDPRVTNMAFLKEWVYAMMALFTYLLGVDVK